MLASTPKFIFLEPQGGILSGNRFFVVVVVVLLLFVLVWVFRFLFCFVFLSFNMISLWYPSWVLLVSGGTQPERPEQLRLQTCKQDGKDVINC